MKKAFAKVIMGGYKVAFLVDELDFTFCNELEKDSLPDLFYEWKHPTGRVKFHGVWWNKVPENCVDKNADFYIQMETDKGAVYYV